MDFYFAPMEGITGYVLRNVHAKLFPGVDRYYLPFIAAQSSHRLKNKEKADVSPEHNAGIRAVPQVLTKSAEDFSENYCQIQNMETGQYVSMDTLAASMLKPVVLKKYAAKDNTLLLRLDYLGFSNWRISPKDSANMCLEDRWVKLDTMAPVGKYNYIGAAHQKWVFIPVEGGLYKIMNKDIMLLMRLAIHMQYQMILQVVKNSLQEYGQVVLL